MILWMLQRALACDIAALPDLDAELQQADAAFADADLDGFAAAMVRLNALVPCLTEPVDAERVARLHRAEGLSAYFATSTERASSAFAAARRIEPAFRFPDELVPIGNPLLDAYHGADPFRSPNEAVPVPAVGTLRFDGVEQPQRPTSVPTLFQRVADGKAEQTQYLWPTDPLPDYALPVAPEPKKL